MSYSTFKSADHVQGPGFNKYASGEVINEVTQAIYERVGNNISGSLTSDMDADIASKFFVARSAFLLTLAQKEALRILQQAFIALEEELRPDRLSGFKIKQATDGELCIYRTANEGIVNLILDEDGEWAYGFSGFKGSTRSNELHFLGAVNNEEAEGLIYSFLAP